MTTDPQPLGTKEIIDRIFQTSRNLNFFGA